VKFVYTIFILFLLLTAVTCKDEKNKQYPPLDYNRPSEQLAYFKNFDPIRGQTADDPPQLFYVDLCLGYEKGNIKLVTELNEKTPSIRNIILQQLSRKKADELNFKNMQILEQELLVEINKLLTKGKLQSVYLQELQVFPY
jgi:flagellar basal body-associated protein FliL